MDYTTLTPAYDTLTGKLCHYGYDGCHLVVVTNDGTGCELHVQDILGQDCRSFRGFRALKDALNIAAVMGCGSFVPNA